MEDGQKQTVSTFRIVYKIPVIDANTKKNGANSCERRARVNKARWVSTMELSISAIEAIREMDAPCSTLMLTVLEVWFFRRSPRKRGNQSKVKVLRRETF